MNNKTIVKEYIEKVVNTGDLGLVKDYISPEYTEIFDNVKHKAGIDGAIEHIKGIRQTYPDLKLKILKQIEEGEWIATDYMMTGTHLGEWMGIKPTGKKIEVSGVNLDRIISGKIVEHGGAANLLHPFIEIGAVKIS